MTRNLLFALVLLFLAGCQRDTTEWTPNPDGSVRFSLKTDDAETEADRAQTRGTSRKSMDAYQMVSMNVFSHTSEYDATTGNDVTLFREIKLKQVDGDWVSTPALIWPEGEKLSFFAYAFDIPFADAGISFSPTTGAPERITYKVPSDVTKQPDLLLSAKCNQLQADNVSMTMKHALACVSFCGVAPKKGTYVKSITLRNVYGEGTLALNASSMAWEVNLDSKGVTVFEAGVNESKELGKIPFPDNNYLMTADGYLMMVPQTLSNAAIDVLYWNGQDETGNKVITYALPIDDASYASWKPGLKYIYKFGSQSADDITVVYYEMYADNQYGLYYDDQGSVQNSLDDKEIVEAGYGVMTGKHVGTVAAIRLTTYSSTPVTTGPVVELTEMGTYLYPVSQSGAATFTLPVSTTPVDVYFNGSDKSCGLILPHFARGVYTQKIPVTAHAIRTPQQMRNITWSSISPVRGTCTYTQELNLDFSKSSIGGEPLTNPVVNREFNDLFDGKKKTIENLNINASKTNGGLFLSNTGEIKDVVLKNSFISSSGNVGGIVATNEQAGVVTSPQVLGENNSDKKFVVQGTSGYVGAIVGLNYGHITGDTTLEKATELPVAEVSGWVLVKGVSQPVGGIVGENRGTITTCLVNGVCVTGPDKGDVAIAKISIEGGDYVGGIVGVNRAKVDGSFSGSGATLQAEPDVAGLVSVSGNNWVGGIAGQNCTANGVLNQVNLRLGRGDATNAITITGKESVGGIVGFNTDFGTLKADGGSFISVRGNVRITGTKNVGGIVGNNESGSISNCFVYNFYSQTNPLVHYAPKITGGSNVGGIVGYGGAGNIKQCAVFSTVSAANVADGNAANAVTEINATTLSAGGIVGHGFIGLKVTTSYVLGNVKVSGVLNSGGIVGENNKETSITSVYIGNSGPEVTTIYRDLFDLVKLPVRDARMQTGTGVMTNTSGAPTIVGGDYIGGICGVNWGVIDGVSIKDNVKIGTPTSDYVGGISGANGVDATVSNCKTYNLATSSVEIQGKVQVGGIIGLNNGVVNQCQLGLPGEGSSRLITIKGQGAVGGIAGTMGGAITGNLNTRITNCNVYGKALIEATGARVGGILGENGPTNQVIDCNVTGYTSSYTDSNTFLYDVTLKGTESIGGIAGANYGDIHGTSATVNNKVTHTAVIASSTYAGGLVGTLKSNNDYQSKLYYCDVSQGVLILTYNNATGAFAGQIEGVGATPGTPTLFGTASDGATNRIYTGTTNPVRISATNSRVVFPPAMDLLPFPAEPPANGNLWADYQMWNYLYWTAY